MPWVWPPFVYLLTEPEFNDILLTYEKHLHEHIISQKKDGSLTPPLFIEVYVPSQEGER
jgi:hypothetical protein